MKIAKRWLTDFINVDFSTEELSKKLTSSGLEVEGVETYCNIPSDLKGVVVGEVKKCDQHPDADRLKVTIVDVGLEDYRNWSYT